MPLAALTVTLQLAVLLLSLLSVTVMVAVPVPAGITVTVVPVVSKFAILVFELLTVKAEPEAFTFNEPEIVSEPVTPP